MSYKLILASASTYKKNLLGRLNIPFEVRVPDIDESQLINESPNQLVKRLALSKAQEVSTKSENVWVIGCDQIAVLGNDIIGKPHYKNIAVEQLKKCSDKQVDFITGVALINQSKKQFFYGFSTVEVKFLALSELFINNYLDFDMPFNCAGSFKVESLGISLFEWVKSQDPTSLEGLPLITLCKLFRNAGIEPLEK